MTSNGKKKGQRMVHAVETALCMPLEEYLNALLHSECVTHLENSVTYVTNRIS